MRTNFDEAGFELVPALVSEAQAQALLAALSQLNLEPLSCGIRRIDKLLPCVDELAHSDHFLATARLYLPGEPRLTRAIYFDKSPHNNWYVTWHQDRTVSVSERFEAAGWGPWSMKSGAWHVQPPLEVLQSMVTIRLHLDPATPDNGCLKIMPGSHNFGLLAADQALGRVIPDRVVDCTSPAGGAVIMRPHILHASGKSISPLPRRILHFEYSSYLLPDGICWNA